MSYDSKNMEFMLEEEKTQILFRGPNCNLVQLLTFIWPKSDILIACNVSQLYFYNSIADYLN